jgi:hypothetical protein
VTGLADIDSAVAALEEAVAAAQALTERNEAVDLAGIDGRVEEILDAVRRLPPSERSNLKPRLVSLLSGLNELARRIQAARDAIADDLRGLADGQRAAAAYRGRPADGRSTKR